MSGEAQRENRQKGPDSGGPGVLDGGADDLDCRTSNVHLENCVPVCSGLHVCVPRKFIRRNPNS